MYPIPPPMKRITTGELKVVGCFLVVLFLIGLGLVIYSLITGGEVTVGSIIALIALGAIALVIVLVPRKTD